MKSWKRSLIEWRRIRRWTNVIHISAFPTSVHLVSIVVPSQCHSHSQRDNHEWSQRERKGSPVSWWHQAQVLQGGQEAVWAQERSVPVFLIDFFVPPKLGSLQPCLLFFLIMKVEVAGRARGASQGLRSTRHTISLTRAIQIILWRMATRCLNRLSLSCRCRRSPSRSHRSSWSTLRMGTLMRSEVPFFALENLFWLKLFSFFLCPFFLLKGSRCHQQVRDSHSQVWVSDHQHQFEPRETCWDSAFLLFFCFWRSVWGLLHLTFLLFLTGREERNGVSLSGRVPGYPLDRRGDSWR